MSKPRTQKQKTGGILGRICGPCQLLYSGQLLEISIIFLENVTISKDVKKLITVRWRRGPSRWIASGSRLVSKLPPVEHKHTESAFTAVSERHCAVRWERGLECSVVLFHFFEIALNVFWHSFEVGAALRQGSTKARAVEQTLKQGCMLRHSKFQIV